MSTGPEFRQVEEPFIDQLISMGWQFTTGNVDFPSATGRDSFREVLILDDLRKAIRRINRNDQGEEWLDEGRVSQGTSALQRLGVVKLMEANQAATRLLLEGLSVEGLPGWDGGRARTIHYIDWGNPANNTFRVVNQFRVDEPGGQARECIVPDLVLFVNGIPLVVVECKSPGITAPVEQAIEQLQRYANQRHWLEGNEGNERLFHYNQFLVATSFDEARVGTVGAQAVHYLEWKDTSPVPMAEVAAELGKTNLSSQEKLVAGMLRPEHLLDLIRHFTLFVENEGRTTKIVARYQQFRAVHAALQRLQAGATRRQDGEHDRRGGIIWHTQGSGKSLTMVFLVRKMRSTPQLRRFKVVVVTDRKDLQKQLSDTAALVGETIKIARKTASLKKLLTQRGPGLVFAMIQKYREPDRETGEVEVAARDEGIQDTGGGAEFPVLNEDESILVIVDEAHRSHANTLHANLLKALPNCARIGFTGTPILMGAKKRTYEIFGELIDRYSLQQSEADQATVPILYEGRTADAALADGRSVDELFEDMFLDRTQEELQKIKAKYATKGHVMEAATLIAAKARDILRHYVDNILPDGFKAQVVAVSRTAAIRYYEAFLQARAELVERLERVDPELLHVDDERLARLSATAQFLVRAHRHLDTLREMEFAPIISGGPHDEAGWAEWTDPVKQALRIARFKKPLTHEDPEKRDPLAFLIVKSMLLTGFDAPSEGVLYLDRPIRDHELLQAIARVNRTYPRKTAGIVVDYYGVARHLKEALSAYSVEDVQGAMRSLQDEIPKLRDRHLRVLAVFRDRGIESLESNENLAACVELLRDERLRAEFHVKLKMFLATLELVLPRPEALPHVHDAKTLGEIQIRARNRYRSGDRPIGKEVGEKVRKLIDDHVISRGIDPKIPPISILDAEFEQHVEATGSDRAKASEMEHAARYHIRKHFDEDPERYQKLSERLEKILAELHDRWEEQKEALRQFLEELRAGRKPDDTGLDPETQAPFLGILRQELAGNGKIEPEVMERLCRITLDLVAHIQQEIRLVGFWTKVQAQELLRSWIVQRLDDEDLFAYERLGAIADRLVELAKARHEKLIR